MAFAVNGTAQHRMTKRYLTLNLLTTTIVAPPSNASKWQMGFNSAFKGLNTLQASGYRNWAVKTDSHIACRAHAVPMLFRAMPCR